MPRTYKLYLQDILESAHKIEQYAKGLDLPSFARHPMAFDAIARNLEIIGEAVKKVPRKTRNQYPQVEWKKIAGLRDIIAHEYFGINTQILWEVISQKVPVLEKQIRAILDDIEKNELPFGSQ
jgi:uncharacterized protein with HEPN domain